MTSQEIYGEVTWINQKRGVFPCVHVIAVASNLYLQKCRHYCAASAMYLEEFVAPEKIVGNDGGGLIKARAVWAARIVHVTF